VIPLSEVASRLGISDDIVGELVRCGILPTLELAAYEEPVVVEQVIEEVQAKAYRALLSRHGLPSEASAVDVEYRWSDEMKKWLGRHPHVEELLEGFLVYVAANTVYHRFTGFRTGLGIRAQGRYANLLPQARGLLLTVTRGKKPIRYLIRTPADFEGGLGWILALEDPILGGKLSTL